MFNQPVQLLHLPLNTERLFIRLADKLDAHRLAEYYAKNACFLKQWEPLRDQSYYCPNAWHFRLTMINEQQRQQQLCYFLIFDKTEKEMLAVAHFTHIVRGNFYACYLGYSIDQFYQGKGIMFEALQSAINYMFSQQSIHRIMANYMPHNQRSGNLLSRLGFQQEGYAKSYLMIDGQWQDHRLMALTNHDWLLPS